MAEAKTETVAKTKRVTAASKTAASDKAVTKKAPTVKSEKPAASPKAKAPATRKTAAAKVKQDVNPQQRYMMICEAAYYKAERRNFAPENEIQDWLDAEAEINLLLGM